MAVNRCWYFLSGTKKTITPGLDTMLVLRTATIGGARRTAAAGFGICLGLLTWGFAASIGVGVLLSTSKLAYNVLRITGSWYMVFLGCRMFVRSGLRLALERGEMVSQEPDVDDARRWFSRDLLTNLLNPKVAVFYVTFLPLFIPARANVVPFSMLVASIHVMEGILWFAVLIAAVQPLSHWLRKTRVEKALSRITGVVFVGFGLRLLFEDK